MTDEFKDGLKHRAFQTCIICDKGMAHGNQLTFYHLRIERHVLDPRAIETQHGLEMMVGSSIIAHALGPDAALSKILDEYEALICQDCGMMSDISTAQIVEIAEDRRKRRHAEEEEA